LATPNRALLQTPRHTVILKMGGRPSGMITRARRYRFPLTRSWVSTSATKILKPIFITTLVNTNSHVTPMDCQNCGSWKRVR
jgi:hypothetical protein